MQISIQFIVIDAVYGCTFDREKTIRQIEEQSQKIFTTEDKESQKGGAVILNENNRNRVTMSLLIKKSNRKSEPDSTPERASEFFMTFDPILFDHLNLKEGDRITGEIQEISISGEKLRKSKGKDISLITGSSEKTYGEESIYALAGQIPTCLYISEKSLFSLIGKRKLEEFQLSITAELKEIERKNGETSQISVPPF